MKVFISWSGSQSRAVAEALHWWLPKVIQGVKPFVSAKDIDKGANWTVELARELEESAFGVVCLTPENLSSPWLHYETGAITRSVDSRVCPLLHKVTKNQVAAPLGQLQLTDLADQNDMVLLMTSMNAAAGHTLSPEDLLETVEMWWPRLKQRLDHVPVHAASANKGAAEPEQPASTDRELLLEVLDAIRHLNGRLAPPQPRPLTSEEEALRDARRSFTTELRATGMEVLQVVPRNSVWTVLLQDLPEPIPSDAYTLLSKYAKENDVTIRVRARGEAGRSVAFDKLGRSSEPPF